MSEKMDRKLNNMLSEGFVQEWPVMAQSVVINRKEV